MSPSEPKSPTPEKRRDGLARHAYMHAVRNGRSGGPGSYDKCIDVIAALFLEAESAAVKRELEACASALRRLIKEAEARAAPHQSGAGARRATHGGLEMALRAIQERGGQ